MMAKATMRQLILLSFVAATAVATTASLSGADEAPKNEDLRIVSRSLQADSYTQDEEAFHLNELILEGMEVRGGKRPNAKQKNQQRQRERKKLNKKKGNSGAPNQRNQKNRKPNNKQPRGPNNSNQKDRKQNNKPRDSNNKTRDKKKSGGIKIKPRDPGPPTDRKPSIKKKMSTNHSPWNSWSDDRPSWNNGGKGRWRGGKSGRRGGRWGNNRSGGGKSGKGDDGRWRRRYRWNI